MASFPFKQQMSCRRLLVYTENYLFGGGNRYLVDTVNAIAGQYDETLIVSNPGALFPNDLKRISPAVRYTTLQILAFARIYHGLGYRPLWVKLILRIMFIILSPLVFIYDFLLFLMLLYRYKPSTMLSCSGGYPSSRTTLIIILAAWCCRIPTALSIVSMPTSRRRLFYLFDVLVDVSVWRTTEKVIVNARAIAAALTVMHGMPEGKAIVIYNGLEEDKQEQISDDNRSSSVPIFQSIHTKMDSIVIACIARMEHGKGIMILLKAFAQLAGRYSHLSLLLVGEGDASSRLSMEVQKLGLENRVCLAGHHEGSIDELLSNIDIYAFPSLHEGFPYSILEAMKAGCAIVASRVGGIPEAINDGQNGLLVEPGSVDELCDAMEKLVEDASLRIRLGGNAKTEFLRNFTINAMQMKLQEIFNKQNLL